MCGIDAVYGKNAVLKALLITLGQIERGDKGTGVAYMCNGEIKVLKEPISPIKFFAKHYKTINVNSRVAIAHNRMPSRGKIAYENTHPFLACDGSFALAHNGTSWNDDEKEYLRMLGHEIKGETDSEILTHILEEYYKATNDYVQALEKLVNYNLDGAIVVLTKNGEIYATKKGFMPLNYVEVEGEIYVASSPQAIANIVNTGVKYEINRVKSKQILRITRKGKTELIGKGEEDYLGFLEKYLYNSSKTKSAVYWRDPETGEWHYYTQ